MGVAAGLLFPRGAVRSHLEHSTQGEGAHGTHGTHGARPPATLRRRCSLTDCLSCRHPHS